MTTEAYLRNWGRGAAFDEAPFVPAPPGTSLGQMDALSLLSELPAALGLQPGGVFVPWATRTGDLDWEEIPRADTHVMVWSLTDRAIEAVPQVTFGAPLPFIGVITKEPLSLARVEALWDGTAYRPYETQALYLTTDHTSPPRIAFLHWGERIDVSELPRQTLAIEPKAAREGGSVVFAAQIPPGEQVSQPGSFDAAYRVQFGPRIEAPPAPPPPGPNPGPIQTAVPLAPPAAGSSNLGVPIAVGVGSVILGFILWRETR